MPTADYKLRRLEKCGVQQFFKSQCIVNFKLIKLANELNSKLSSFHDQSYRELGAILDVFRRRTADIKRDNRCSNYSSLFDAWDEILRALESEKESHHEMCQYIQKEVIRPTTVTYMHWKNQSKKLCQHLESLEQQVHKHEEAVEKCMRECHEAYSKSRKGRGKEDVAHLDGEYHLKHNNYMLQLKAANALLDYYYNHALPDSLDDMEDIQRSVSDTLSKNLGEEAAYLSTQHESVSERLLSARSSCVNVSCARDLEHVVDLLNAARGQHQQHARRRMSREQSRDLDDVPTAEEPRYVKCITYRPPEGAPQDGEVPEDLFQTPPTEGVLKTKHEALAVAHRDTERHLQHLEEELDDLILQQRKYLSDEDLSKCEDLQEVVVKKRHDIRLATFNLVTLKAQLDMFANKQSSLLSTVDKDGSSGGGVIAKESGTTASSSSSAHPKGIREKWKWAFRKLSKDNSKDSGVGSDTTHDVQEDGSVSERAKARGKGDDDHDFLKHDFKRLVRCDHCKEAITGINKIGMRCRICKMGVHIDCVEQVTAKCLPANDKRRLLKKQLSTSAIDMGKLKMNLPLLMSESEEKLYKEKQIIKEEPPQPKELDPVYQLLRCAGSLTRPAVPQPYQPLAPHMATGGMSPGPGMPGTLFHQQRGPGPQSTMHGASGGYGYPDIYYDHLQEHQHQQYQQHQEQQQELSSQQGQPQQYPAPQSPTHKKGPLMKIKTDSLELPDEADRSHSSGSTSPCPSPKSQRLLPSYVYVAMKSFSGQAADELDLRAGQTLSVIDTTNQEWWKGRIGDYVGYFPSHIVTRLHGGEKICSLLQPVSIGGQAGAGPAITFAKDQIVVWVREDAEGMSLIRGLVDKAWVPTNYLHRIA